MSEALPSNAGYAAEAEACLKRYEARSSEAIHADWLHLFPAFPCNVVDIGAGTGRDAGWLADKGCTVLAVEPTAELRKPAQILHPELSITWLDDILPNLDHVRARNETFDLVLMNAVWMHLTEAEQQTAMPIIASLMRPGARWFMTLRHGPVPKGRRMFEVTADETITRAEPHGLKVIYNERKDSIQMQNKARGVTWTKLVLERE